MYLICGAPLSTRCHQTVIVVRRIEQTDLSGQWQQLLNQILRLVESTPHTVTGVTTSAFSIYRSYPWTILVCQGTIHSPPNAWTKYGPTNAIQLNYSIALGSYSLTHSDIFLLPYCNFLSVWLTVWPGLEARAICNSNWITFYRKASPEESWSFVHSVVLVSL